MVDVSDAVSVIDCAELYVPAGGETVGAVVSIVYSAVTILPELFAVSFAKYFTVMVSIDLPTRDDVNETDSV